VNVNLKKVILFSLLWISSGAFADFEELVVKRETDTRGHQRLCIKPFVALRGHRAQCIRVSQVTEFKLNSSDPELKITELSLVALGLDTQSKQTHFGAIVEWKGKGSGVLSISGPQGKLFAVGSVVPDATDPSKSILTIEQFSDESLSEQFDRGVLFGESDALRLHAKTKVWLEGVLGPAIEQSLNRGKTNSLP
jgi:hypothetical protein